MVLIKKLYGVRLDPDTIDLIKHLTERYNKVYTRKITESELLRMAVDVGLPQVQQQIESAENIIGHLSGK